MKILPFTRDFLEPAKALTDQEIGDGYFSLEQLQAYLEGASLLLLDENAPPKKNVVGIRLTLTPAQLKNNSVRAKLTPELWQIDAREGAYFQSLFINEKYQGMGWGKKLSESSIEILKSMGAKAVACHSWKESPNNSSMRYLQKMNFQIVKEHPKFWYDVDYTCTRCGRPCVCTAAEMVKYL